MKHILFFSFILFHQASAKLEAYGLKVKKPLTPLIKVNPNKTHRFQVTSHTRRKPVHVHFQNEDYVSVKCHKMKNTKDGQHKHRCKMRFKEVPQGSLAVFKKQPDGTDKILFHVSTEQDGE